MRRRIAIGCVMVASVLSFGAGSAAAQVFGTFTWQMQPYCNRVTLTLTSVTGNFTLDGSDDQCGAAKKASATGIGVFNPDGTVGINFTIVTAPGGGAAHVAASVSPADGQGTWSDDSGNTGTFAFFGNTAGLPSRPSALAQFRVTDRPSTALAASTTVTLPWSAAPAENLGGGTFVPGAGTYAVPTAGIYLVTSTVRWTAFASATGYYCIGITVNGSNRSTTCDPPSTTAQFQMQSISTAMSLTAGQLVAIRALNFTGGAASAAGSGADVAFTVTRLR